MGLSCARAFDPKRRLTVAVDTNNDGHVDTWYHDTQGTGHFDLIEQDTNHDGKLDKIMKDTAQDGKPDTVYLDTNHSGVFDTVKYDFTGDGKFNQVEKDETGITDSRDLSEFSPTKVDYFFNGNTSQNPDAVERDKDGTHGLTMDWKMDKRATAHVQHYGRDRSSSNVSDIWPE